MLVGKKLQSNAGFWLLKIFEHCNKVQRVSKRYKIASWNYHIFLRRVRL